MSKKDRESEEVKKSAFSLGTLFSWYLLHLSRPPSTLRLNSLSFAMSQVPVTNVDSIVAHNVSKLPPGCFKDHPAMSPALLRKRPGPRSRTSKPPPPPSPDTVSTTTATIAVTATKIQEEDSVSSPSADRSTKTSIESSIVDCSTAICDSTASPASQSPAYSSSSKDTEVVSLTPSPKSVETRPLKKKKLNNGVQKSTEEILNKDDPEFPPDINDYAKSQPLPSDPKEYLTFIPSRVLKLVTFSSSIKCEACSRAFPAHVVFGRTFPQKEYYEHCIERCPNYTKTVSCHRCKHNFLNQDEFKCHSRTACDKLIKQKLVAWRLRLPWMDPKLFWDILANENSMNGKIDCPAKDLGCRESFRCYSLGKKCPPYPELGYYYHAIEACHHFITGGRIVSCENCGYKYVNQKDFDEYDIHSNRQYNRNKQ